MRRDMDLVRDILKQVADSPRGLTVGLLSTDTKEFQTVCYHVDIMIEAGLITGSVSKSYGGQYVSGSIESLTWVGNDFLDAVSDSSVWAHVKEQLAKYGSSVPFDVVKALAITAIKMGMGI